jgi:3-hydroxyisobutyrate dehydrogenase
MTNHKINIAFIGMGVMGAPMAGHLADKLSGQYDVSIYNRNIDKALAVHKKHPSLMVLNNLDDIAKHADFIFMCIGNDDSVRQTVNQLLAACPDDKKLVIVDHTTTSARLAQEMQIICQKQGSQFLDCPVSGGEAGAINGKLTVMAGGDAHTFQQSKHILSVYSQAQNYFGPSGSGQTAKMANQILIANILQGLSEALNLAQTANLDIDLLVDTLSLGAAGSWQLANRGKTMTRDQFNFGFAIDHMIKDLGIVKDFAASMLIPLPQTEKILATYQSLSEKGAGRLDTSALIKQFEKS